LPAKLTYLTKKYKEMFKNEGFLKENVFWEDFSQSFQYFLRLLKPFRSLTLKKESKGERERRREVREKREKRCT